MFTFSRQKYLYFIAFMLMATTFLPLVFNNLPPLIRSHHVWTILWGIFLLVLAPKVFMAKSMLYVEVYGLFLLMMLNNFWINMDAWNTSMLIKEYYQIAIGISVITYFQQTKEYISLAKITKWSLIFILITAVMSIVTSVIDPLYARNMIAASIITSESELERVMSFRRYGGGGYGTAIAFMSLMPLLIYYFRNICLVNIKKTNLVIFGLILFIALIAIQIFTNVLIAFFVTVLSLIIVQNRKITIVIAGIILLLLALIPKNIYINGLYNISNCFSKGSEMNYKLDDIALFLETGASIYDPATAMGSRANRYPMLLESFQKSPVLGCYFLSSASGNGYQEQGAHLHWMNKLTTTGIIGLLFFLAIPFFHLKQQLKLFSKEYGFYFLLASLTILIYGLFKTITGRDAWYAFFIILPGMYCLPLLKKNKEGLATIANNESNIT